MSIGTNVIIGWNAAAVKAGFAALRGAFNLSMRGLRQVGIGAARQLGAGMTDTLGKVLTAVPEGIKEMMDWSGNLVDMSNQTGMAVSELVVLEEALRMSGAAASDTSRILSVLKKNIFEASKEAVVGQKALNKYGVRGGLDDMEAFSAPSSNAAAESLRKLGLSARELQDLKLDQSFEKIGRAVASFQGDSGELEDIMSNLFGAKMGYKFIRFFKDFSGNMEEAQKNAGPFARRLDNTAESYDRLSDALARYKMRWRELMAIIVDQATGLFGDGFIDKGFDWFSPEKIRASIVFLREELAGLFSGDGFSGMLEGAGRAIGKGISESLREVIPSLSIGDMIKGAIGIKPASRDNSTSQLIDIGRQQLRSLNAIQNSGFPAVLA